MRDDALRVLDAAQRGSALTQKMLALARQMPTSPRAVDVSEALDEVGQLLERVLGKNIVLTVHSGESVGRVMIDPASLDQVLLNMAINARDAMPDGGTLVIEAERTFLNEAWSVGRDATLQPGPYVVISVTDSGTGMAPDVVDHIFEPFFTTKQEGHGNGLGLPTCWNLVRQAAGTISVHSELGVGTTMRVHLPLVEDASVVEDASHSRQSLPVPTEGRRIIVAEDDADVRELVSRILRARGYRVIEASSGAEALLLLEDVGTKIDLLVTDVVMPRMSGLDLASRVARQFPTIRILLLSGYAPASLARHGTYSTSLPLLSKPFTPERLLAAVRHALAT